MKSPRDPKRFEALRIKKDYEITLKSMKVNTVGMRLMVEVCCILDQVASFVE